MIRKPADDLPHMRSILRVKDQDAGRGRRHQLVGLEPEHLPTSRAHIFEPAAPHAKDDMREAVVHLLEALLGLVDRVLHMPARGDVRGGAVQPHGLPMLVAHDARLVVYPQRRPMTCQQSILDGQWFVRGNGRGFGGEHPFAVLRMDPISEQRRVGLPLLTRIAEQRFHLFIHHEADGKVGRSTR